MMKIEIVIPIQSINKEDKKYLESIQKQEKFDKNDYEQKLKILKLDKTSKCKILHLVSDSKIKENENNAELLNYNPYVSLILNYIYLYQNEENNNYSSSLESTAINSKIIENTSKIIAHELIEKQFNMARTTFCLKYKFYDISLTPELTNFNHPIKYKINDEYFSFVYPNELITFCITVSGFIFKNNMLNSEPKCIEYKESNFNQILGLFFCGNNIKLNENTIKKCAPNEFICKDCVEINKKTYNLKSHYLINFYGRVCKKNKGVYHCFGKFLVNKKIEDCITSYVCRGCSFLNSFLNYYNT